MHALGHSVNNELLQLNECICPDYKLTYKCDIVGDGATIWKGSAFDCGVQIVLSHSTFVGAARQSCDNVIMARGVNVTDTGNNTQCFSSQLNITVNPSMRNKSVECTHDSADGSTVIGTSTLVFTTGRKDYTVGLLLLLLLVSTY